MHVCTCAQLVSSQQIESLATAARCHAWAAHCGHLVLGAVYMYLPVREACMTEKLNEMCNSWVFPGRCADGFLAITLAAKESGPERDSSGRNRLMANWVSGFKVLLGHSVTWMPQMCLGEHYGGILWHRDQCRVYWMSSQWCSWMGEEPVIQDTRCVELKLRNSPRKVFG